MARRLGTVTVATVFTRSCYRVDGTGDVEAITEVRRLEDQAALAASGAMGIHLGLDDASLRSSYCDEAAYMDSSLDPGSDPIWPSAVRSIGALMEGKHFHRLILPLDVGGMIDHAITRNAGLLFAKHVRAIWFYKDATYLRSEEKIQALAKEHDAIREKILRPVAQDTKLALIAQYSSQINQETIASIDADLAAYGGERVWIRDSRNAQRCATNTTAH